MSSTFTTNKSLEEPANGDYTNTWNVPVNANTTAIDLALAGTTAINVASASGIVALTLTQYRPAKFEFTGTLTASVNYQLPTGIGGQWAIYNGTSGAFTLTFSISGGNSVTLNPGWQWVISDGGQVATVSSTPTSSSANANLPLVLNNSGVLAYAASAYLNPSTGLLTVTAFNASSDARLKTDITPIKDALSRISSIHPVSFKWRETGKLGAGVIAQEVVKALPCAVNVGSNGILAVDPLALIGLLVGAVQELDQQVRLLKHKPWWRFW
jgi:hypothetical protein